MQMAWKPKLKSDFINLFICIMLILPVITKLLDSLNFLPTQYITYAVYGFLWLCFIVHISQNINSFLYISIMVLALTLFICTLESLIFPDNNQYIWSFDLRLIVTLVPYNLFGAMMLVIPGLLVTDYDGFLKVLNTVSRVGIAIGALSYILFLALGRELHYDDMNFSYSLCILVCTLILMNEKRDWLFIAVGFLCMFVAGTRGPLVCTIAATVFNVITNKKKNKTFVYLLFGAVAITVVQTNIITVLVNSVGDLLASFGFEDLRLLDYFNEGNIADTSGRSGLQSVIWDAISQRPFFGHGVGSDRLLLDGAYAHNIFLEVLCSFGVLFGGMFLAGLVVLMLLIVFSKNDKLRIIAFIFITAVVLKLFFSSSFFTCREFSLLLGICIRGAIRNGIRSSSPEMKSYKEVI